MNDQTMLLNSMLEPAEKEKVERLDGAIAARFYQAGLVVRFCQGGGAGGQRSLTFFSDILGIDKVGSVRSADFLDASDIDVVARIC